jgi:6-phosphogluconate dehydrogenase (decarboxylating)
VSDGLTLLGVEGALDETAIIAVTALTSLVERYREKQQEDLANQIVGKLGQAFS